jgi:hypothetical protein
MLGGREPKYRDRIPGLRRFLRRVRLASFDSGSIGD